MRINEIYYDNRQNKYIIQFIDAKGITWFRELSTPNVYHSPKSFGKWLDSLIEDVKLRSK